MILPDLSLRQTDPQMVVFSGKARALMAQRLSATFVLCSQVWSVSESQVWLQGHTGPDCIISTDFKHRRTTQGEGSFRTHWKELNTFLEQYRSQVMHLPLKVVISLQRS